MITATTPNLEQIHKTGLHEAPSTRVTMLCFDRRHILFASLLLGTITFCLLSYLFGGEFDTRKHSKKFGADQTVTRGGKIVVSDKEDIFPLPNVTHPVVSMSSQRYLNMLRRGKYRLKFAEFESRGFVPDQNRSIVLRYRANTSTLLKPKPGAGRLSAIFMGRTGNRMRIYAALYGIARRNGMHHVVSADNPLLKLFDLKAAVIPAERPGRDWVKYVPEFHGYDRHTEYFDPYADIELVSFFPYWPYYQPVMRDVIRNHFRFRKDIRQEADAFLRRSMASFNLSTTDVAVIAVHIRRTDQLARLSKEQLAHSTLYTTYFSHAIAFFNRLFNNKTMYVVCSDDIKWSKRNFVTKSPTVFSVGHNADVDFAILSRCNHSILTLGTYGRWTAYIAGGITVIHNKRSPAENLKPLAVINVKADPMKDPRIRFIGMS